MIFNSVGGGTGSGLGSLLLERLSVDYGRKTKLNFVIQPSNAMISSPTEAYNAVLATHYSLEHVDCSFVF